MYDVSNGKSRLDLEGSSGMLSVRDPLLIPNIMLTLEDPLCSYTCTVRMVRSRLATGDQRSVL